MPSEHFNTMDGLHLAPTLRCGLPLLSTNEPMGVNVYFPEAEKLCSGSPEGHNQATLSFKVLIRPGPSKVL